MNKVPLTKPAVLIIGGIILFVVGGGVGAAVSHHGNEGMRSGKNFRGGFPGGRGGQMARSVVSGNVTAIQGSTLTVHGSDGDWAVQTDSSTRFRTASGDIKLSDIKTGDQIRVSGPRDEELGMVQARSVVKSIAAGTPSPST